MRTFWKIVAAASIAANAAAAFAQSADPAVTSAVFSPASVAIGATSRLTTTFSNLGTTAIPAASIEVTICPANNYYVSSGAVPGGPGGALFTWTHLLADCWRGSNIALIAASAGGDIWIDYAGTTVTPSPQTTNVNIQLVANLGSFNNNPGNDNLTADLSVVVAPNLVIAKIAPASMTVGVAATYSFTVTNNGTGVATTATVKDAIPSGLNYTGFSGTNWTCTPANGTGPVVVTCTYSNATGIAANGGTDTALKLNVTPTVASAGVTNYAAIDPTGGPTPPAPGPGCAPAASCTSAGPTPVVAPILAVAKIAPASMTVGVGATYSFTVTNTGTGVAKTATIKDAIPSGLNYTGFSGTNWTCTPANGTGPIVVTCTYSNATGIAANGGTDTALKLNVTPTVASAGVTNYAAIDPTGGPTPPAPGPGCAPAASCTSAGPTPVVAPILAIAKSAPASMTVGVPATYSFTVTNNGTGVAKSATVKDAIPSGLNYTGFSGANWTCTPANGTGPIVVTCTYSNATGIAAGGNDTALKLNVTPTVASAGVTNYAAIDPTGGPTPPAPGPGCAPAASCTSAGPTPVSGTPPTLANDATSAFAGSTGNTFNVKSNDPGVPAGAAYSVQASTCPAPAATVVSATGVVTYSAPAVVGATCTVTIQVCNPAPDTGTCSTETLTVTAVTPPDLLPTFTFGTTTYVVGDSRDVIININEINGVATAGLIQFFVPNSTGFQYTFDNTRTDAVILGINNLVDNADWTATPTGSGTLYSSNVSIPASDRSRLVITSTALTAGVKGSITVNIVSGSGGEVRIDNDSVVLSQSIQR